MNKQLKNQLTKIAQEHLFMRRRPHGLAGGARRQAQGEGEGHGLVVDVVGGGGGRLVPARLVELIPSGQHLCMA